MHLFEDLVFQVYKNDVYCFKINWYGWPFPKNNGILIANWSVQLSSFNKWYVP